MNAIYMKMQRSPLLQLTNQIVTSQRMQLDTKDQETHANGHTAKNVVCANA